MKEVLVGFIVMSLFVIAAICFGVVLSTCHSDTEFKYKSVPQSSPGLAEQAAAKDAVQVKAQADFAALKKGTK